MKYKKIAILMMLVLLTACTVNDTNEKESATDQGSLPQNDQSGEEGSELVTYGVAGYIVELNKDDEVIRILVEGELGKNGADYDSAWVTLDEETVVYGEVDMTLEDLMVGQYVNVFFKGDVMESYPVQASGRQINVIPEEALQFHEDESE